MVTRADQRPKGSRNALLLMLAQSFNGAVSSIAITVGALAGSRLLGDDKSLATLPITGFLAGTALGAVPAAWLMGKVGRRKGFVAGTVVAMLGGAVCGLGMQFESFLMLIVGLTLCGLAASFVQQYRFAAADTGSSDVRARAISLVLLGGVAAAVIGPQTVIATQDLLAPVPFAGAFYAIGGLSMIGLLVVSMLGGQARAAPKKTDGGGGRPLMKIAVQPQFMVAVINGVGAYAIMMLLMTAAPLAMVHHHLSETSAALGVQWHLVAMYAPSFFTGALIAARR